MPVAIPQTIRRALGEEAVVDFIPWMERWLSESIKEKAVPRDEYREVLSRLDGLGKDISLFKEEQIRMRAEFSADLAQMRGEFSADLAQMRGEFSADLAQMRGEFREDQAQMRAELREDLGQLRREMNERFDGINGRFDGINGRFDQMNQHFESRLDQMSERMLVQTRWLIGSIALFGTILTVMMAIAQFTP